MKAEKKQTYPTVEDLVALMEPDVLYTQREFVERTDWTSGAIRQTLDLAVARREMERLVHRKRHHYRLHSAQAVSELPGLHRRGDLAGWDKQWRQFRVMCEAARPNTGTPVAQPDAESVAATAPPVENRVDD